MADQRRSDALTSETCFFDIQFPAQLEEDLVMNSSLSAKPFEFVALCLKQVPRQLTQRLILVE